MALGFPRHALFPDLDALAQSVVDTCNVVGYGRPAPPRWEEDEHSDYAEPAHQQ